MGLFLPVMVGWFVVLAVGIGVYTQGCLARLYRRQRAQLPAERVGSVRTVREAKARGVRGTFVVDYRTMNGFVFVWWTAADVAGEAAAEGVSVESGRALWDRLETDVATLALTDTFTPWCTGRHLGTEGGDAVLICSGDGLIRAWRWARLQREFPDAPVVYTNTCVQRMAAEFLRRG